MSTQLRRISSSRLAKTLSIHLFFCMILIGCATPPKVIPPLPRDFPKERVGEVNVMLLGFKKKGGDCLKREIEDYLQATENFVLVHAPETPDERQMEEFIEDQKVKLLFHGEIEKFTADWRGADTAWGGMNSFIYAIASGRVRVTDKESEKEIWSRRETVFVEGLPQKGDVKEILLQAACKNLATKMVNDFLKSYIPNTLQGK